MPNENLYSEEKGIDKPKFNVEECKQRDLTYSSSLMPTLRLVIYDIDHENNTKQILSAKEQEVFIGDLPLMTPSATFITNGVEFVVNDVILIPVDLSKFIKLYKCS